MNFFPAPPSPPNPMIQFCPLLGPPPPPPPPPQPRDMWHMTHGVWHMTRDMWLTKWNMQRNFFFFLRFSASLRTQRGIQCLRYAGFCCCCICCRVLVYWEEYSSPPLDGDEVITIIELGRTQPSEGRSRYTQEYYSVIRFITTYICLTHVNRQRRNALTWCLDWVCSLHYAE